MFSRICEALHEFASRCRLFLVLSFVFGGLLVKQCSDTLKLNEGEVI